MREKLKYILLVIAYVTITTAVVWLLKNRQWVECQLSFTEPPIFQSEPFEWKGTGLITLWFDDNWLSQYENAFPVMQKFNFKGVVSVITSAVCAPNYMGWKQIYELQRNGWEMVSHSKYHICDPYVLENSPNLLRSETEVAKKELAEHKIYTNIFVTPCGYPTYLYSKIRNEILNSYSTIRIAESTINHLPVTDSTNLTAYFIDDSVSLETIQEWINETKKQSGWLILTFHQIGTGPPYFLNTANTQFKDILDLVKKSELPVVLPSQVIGAKRKPLTS